MKWVDMVEDFIPMLTMSIMIAVIILQVFFRYVLSNALDWPEELARYAFIACVYLGSGLAAKYGRHLEISIAKEWTPPNVSRVITIVAALLSMAYCAVITVWGTKMVLFVHETQQATAALGVPMFWFYIPLPVGMAWIGIRTFTHLLQILRGEPQRDGAGGGVAY